MSLADDRKPRVPRQVGNGVEPPAPVAPLTRVFLRLAEAIGAVGTIAAAVALAVLLLA
jgi:hypothetical protein